MKLLLVQPKLPDSFWSFTWDKGELLPASKMHAVSLRAGARAFERVLGHFDVPSLRPAVHFRSHDAPVSQALGPPYTVSLVEDRFEVSSPQLPPVPPLRMRMVGRQANFVVQHERHTLITYRTEEARGYEARGELWSHGHFKVQLTREEPATLIASTEPWETVTALGPAQAQR